MSWVPLDRALALGRERIGNKAARLAELSQAGFSVPEGWVLPVDAVEQGDFETAAHELLGLDPRVDRWIVRSSSPLEDRPGRSAAGLFHSEAASGPELVGAMRRVADSRKGEVVGALLEIELPAPLAMLAQPELTLERFALAELRRDRAPSIDGDEDDQLHEVLLRLRRYAQERAQLAELGRDERGWWVLQLRPAPARALPESAGERWRRDHEHSPLPMCPLLAGVFEHWLQWQTKPKSRIARGVWFDRVRAPAKPTESEAEALLAESIEKMQTLEAQARELQRAAKTEPWDRFVHRWLEFQELYFDRPVGRLRARLGDSEPAARGLYAVRREEDLARLQHFEMSREEFLAAHGHHAAWPWDGRGLTWAEDPSQLDELLNHPIEASRPKPDRSLATRIAEHLEDDDDALARSYAAFRAAARRAALSAGFSDDEWDDVLDLTPMQLASLLRDPSSLDRGQAVAAGRRRWEQWLRESVQARENEELVGVPVVAGDVTARARVLRAATADGGPREGEILVVCSIQPADAIVFGRIAGLIVEGGDRLGHAAVLARERGVPCVVGVVGACEELQGQPRVHLDAERGRVRRLDS